MTDETFGGYTMADIAYLEPEEVLAAVNRLAAENADLRAVVKGHQIAGTLPCSIDVDGEVHPLPDGLVVLIDGKPHRLERCPKAAEWECVEGLVQSGTHPGVHDAPCPTCRWESAPPGWVAVPVDTEEET